MSHSNPSLKRKASSSETTAKRYQPSNPLAHFNVQVAEKLKRFKPTFDFLDTPAAAELVFDKCSITDPQLAAKRADVEFRLNNDPEFCDRVVALRDKNDWDISNWAGIYPLLGLPPLPTTLSIDAHASNEISPGLPNPPSTPAPNVYSVLVSTSKVATTVGQLLEDFKDNVKDLISNPQPALLWSPPAEFQHCEPLKIPAPDGRSPKLPFHELGDWLDSLPDLPALDILVNEKNDTFVYNTSGSGKTRLVLETLCHRWGIYVSFAEFRIERFGSDELTLLFSTMKSTGDFRSHIDDVKKDASQAARNHSIAEHLSRSALLARLLVFHAFLEACNAKDSLETRKLWLRVQCHPRSILKVPDIIELLSSSFMHHNDHNFITKAYFDTTVFIHTMIKSPFIIVVDECQVAANAFPHAFASDGEPRSFLRPFLVALSGNFRYFVVLTGTGIDKEGVEKTYVSTHGKRAWSLISDLGGFDEEHQQANYIAKFLFANNPPYSAEQSRFLSRCWHYLRGRHRFTVSFIETVLYLQSKAYDKVLDRYVFDMTGVHPQDKHSVRESSVVKFPQGRFLRPITFSNLSKVSTDIHDSILGMVGDWLIDQRNTTLHMDADKYAVVEAGFARIMVPRGESRDALVYEIKDPLVLLAARKYFEAAFSALMLKTITYSPSSAAQGEGMDKIIAYFITREFDNIQTLGDIFDFPNTLDTKWTRLKARLVALCGDDIVPASWNNGVHTALVRWTTHGAEQTVSWFRNREGIPILRPDVNMKPDILALLQLEDGDHLWIAIQVKLRRPHFISSEVKNGASSLVPDKWWTKKGVLSDRDSSNQDEVCRIMISVPRLYNPNLEEIAPPTARPQDTLKQRGLLRVLAYVGGDVNMKDVKDAAEDGAGPLALLKVDRLTKRFGVTIDLLRNQRD